MTERRTRVLVTGGAGFIGSSLCEALPSKGHHVICLDNFTTGSRDNVSHLLDTSHFELIEADICDPVDVDVDQIYNLACPASPIKYQAEPIQTIRASTQGTLQLLECADRIGARFLQASTSEVYGDPEVHPQPESYWGHVNPVGIRSCYDEGKRVSETLCFEYHRQRSLEIRIVRIFNTYGPRMALDDGRVVSNFIRQALRGNSITVFGDGKQTRSFCYVDDLVKGLITMMEQDEAMGPVNLGNPHELSIGMLAEKIIAQTGSRSDLIYKPLPQDDPTRRCPDITLARRLLQFNPTTNLSEGLEKTIAFFSQRID
jgi:UDP-glucuronate decarboxylase